MAGEHKFKIKSQASVKAYECKIHVNLVLSHLFTLSSTLELIASSLIACRSYTCLRLKSSECKSHISAKFMWTLFYPTWSLLAQHESQLHHLSQRVEAPSKSQIAFPPPKPFYERHQPSKWERDREKNKNKKKKKKYLKDTKKREIKRKRGLNNKSRKSKPKQREMTTYKHTHTLCVCVCVCVRARVCVLTFYGSWWWSRFINPMNKKEMKDYTIRYKGPKESFK